MTSGDAFELLARRNPVTAAVRDELAVQVEELRPQLPALAALPLRREPAPRVRLGPRRSSRSVLLSGAAVAAAAVVALTVAAPWRGGPTILERAAAAILAPTSGQILYESIAIHPSISGARGGVTHVRVWLDGASPHRFRVTFDGPQPGDIGGTLGGVTGLSYAFSDDVLDPVSFSGPVSQASLDPAAFIKKALTSGRAQLDGTTTLRGHEVLRIRVSSNPFGHPQPIALYFVDAHTYRPIRVALIATTRPDPYRVGFPLAALSFLPSAVSFGFSHARGQYPFVCDFAQYRYLAPTAANRKLTNIRAAHPHAKIV
jgi:hypothetical protein